MATVLRNATVVADSVDLSSHVRELDVTLTRDGLDVTTIGQPGRAIIPGTLDATVACTFFQDFAAGQIDATLKRLFDTQTPFRLVVGGGPATPVLRMNALLLNYIPIRGEVGAAAMSPVIFQSADETTTWLSVGLVLGTSARATARANIDADFLYSGGLYSSGLYGA